MINKVEEIMAFSGEARGMVIASDWDYVLAHYGEEAIEKIERRMTELGHPLEYKKINKMGFYPIGLDVLSMLVIQEQLGFDREEMEKMGAFGPTTSIIIKVIMRYFLSAEDVFNNIDKIWRKHYTVGRVSIDEMTEGRVAMSLSEFKVHPAFCPVIAGYARKVLEMINNKETRVVESKCPFRGDDVHQFTIEWDV